MNDTKLNRLLNSIGKRVFVRYFHEFDNFSSQDMIALLRNKESFTRKACTSRTHHAKRIFHEGMQVQALAIITESNRVEPKATEKARVLLSQLRSVRSSGPL
jgi:hypothetical protein